MVHASSEEERLSVRQADLEEVAGAALATSVF